MPGRPTRRRTGPTVAALLAARLYVIEFSGPGIEWAAASAALINGAIAGHVPGSATVTKEGASRLPSCHRRRSVPAIAPRPRGTGGQLGVLSMAGRPEGPLDPSAGPVARFAAELRKLRAEAGSPTYRVMAQRSGQGASTLSQAAAGERLSTLPVALAYARACGGDETEWEERWRETAAELAAEPRPQNEDDEPPYRGLVRFEPGDADLFFGRDQLTNRLLELTRSRRFTAVFGPSGSGKSSLLRAGLIPRLRSPETTGPQPAAVRILTPGEHPLRIHEQRLIPKDADGDTWLIVDQFEELYTLCTDPAERNQFIDRLMAAADAASRLRVVIAVRADFLGRCAEHPALTTALQDATVLVGPMNRDELREAITKPAQAAGVIVERGLTARILDEVQGEPGALPLMSHALLETWRRRKGRALTTRAYEASGGLHGAIARTAEDVHAHLTPSQADLARRILLRLITPGEGTPDTRRPAPRKEFDFSEPADTVTVLEHLARARLLTLEHDAVDLAHEALITAWPRLRAWIDTDRERLRIHRSLTEAARTWDDLKRDPGALYRGTRLAVAEEHFAAPEPFATLTGLEQTFLTAGRAARTGEHRRRRGFVAGLAVLVTCALIAGVVAWQQTRTSGRRHLEAESRRLAAVATSMRFSDPVTAMQLSLAAWRLNDSTETRSALLGAVTQREEDVFSVPGTKFDYNGGIPTVLRAMTAEGRSLVSVTADRVNTWDLHTHRLSHSFPGLGKLLDGDTSVVVAPNGLTLALVTLEGTIKLWDVRTARVTATLNLDTPHTASFSPDGGMLVVEDDGPDGSDPSLQVWDLRHHRVQLRIPEHEGESLQLASISSDNQWLALCTDARPLQVWDISAGRKALHAPWESSGHHACSATALTIAPDNMTLTVLAQNKIRRWDISTGHSLPSLEADGMTKMQFDSHGSFLVAVGARQLLVWRMAYPDAPVLSQKLTTDTQVDLAFDSAAGAVRYLNQGGTIVRTLSLGRTTTSQWDTKQPDKATLSQDGRTLARLRSADGTEKLQILDTRTGRVVFEPTTEHCPEGGRPDTPECADLMALSPDGRYVASGVVREADQSGTPSRPHLTVWDIATHRPYATITLRPKSADIFGLTGLALDAHARTLLAYRDTTPPSVEVWDLHHKELITSVRSDQHTLTGPTTEGGMDMALRPDGRMLVTQPGLVVDVASRRMEPRELGEGLITAAAFGPHHTYLAVGDDLGRVTLWDGAARHRLGVLTGTTADSEAAESGEVTALAFSHDGSTLVVGGEGGTVQLWDVASRRLLGSALPTPGDLVGSLAFSSDDSTLYAAGAHVPAQTYSLDPDRLARQVCQRVRSGLSARDWHTYLPDVPYRRTCPR
ncbi:DNA-binding protein [Streptomyces sp. NPDC008240]|uniref:nSTAND1 domain-containing NTPase n=2 Tax=unclassified Streptomyces TaxID=2593676 RepID=UPI0036E945AC